MSSTLSLERLEFKLVHVKTNLKATAESDRVFPQLKVDLSAYEQMYRSSLTYDHANAEDPRVFVLSYGIKLDGKEGTQVPYEVEVEAVAFMRYDGDDHEGQDRFRAVRMSGYQIIHGAIREMVANITARGRHGLMQLPARNFNPESKAGAEQDEHSRQEYLQNVQLTRSTGLERQPSIALDGSPKSSNGD